MQHRRPDPDSEHHLQRRARPWAAPSACRSPRSPTRTSASTSTSVPRVHHNREITLKGKIEISALSGEVAAARRADPADHRDARGSSRPSGCGTTRPTSWPVSSGRPSATRMSGVVGLSDIPVLQRACFGSTQTTIESDRHRPDADARTSSACPDITDEDLEPLWIGTERERRARGASRKGAFTSPFGNAEEGTQYPGIPDVPRSRRRSHRPRRRRPRTRRHRPTAAAAPAARRGPWSPRPRPADSRPPGRRGSAGLRPAEVARAGGGGGGGGGGVRAARRIPATSPIPSGPATRSGSTRRT